MVKKPYLIQTVGLTLNLLRQAPTYLYTVESVAFNLKPALSQFKLLLDTLRTIFFADSIIEIISFIKINLLKIIALIEISLFPLSHSPN